MPTIWDDFAETYPTAYRTGMSQLLDYINNNASFDTFAEFARATTEEMADLLVDYNATDSYSVKQVNKDFAYQLIDVANAVNSCSPPVLLDNLFMNAIRSDDRAGALALLNSLKEDTPGVTLSASEFLTSSSEEKTAKGLTMATKIGTMPCSHEFIRGKAQTILQDAAVFLEAQTEKKQLSIKLSFGGNVLSNYKFEWYKVVSSEPVPFLSSIAGVYGDTEVNYAAVNNGDETISAARIRILDQNNEPIVFTFDILVDPPAADTSQELSFPPGTEELTKLKNIEITALNTSGTSQTIDSTFLEAIEITGTSLFLTFITGKKLSAVASAGGVENMSGVPELLEADIPRAEKINNYAVMEIISPNYHFNKLLYDNSITNPRELILKSRSEFGVLGATATSTAVIGDYKVAEVYQKAVAFNTYLDNYIIEWRKTNGN